ncbi:unnamed protein product [Ilex paraguariensis]|uniref:Exocyst subunit Exo70 family protein n=1 Tax=Ilex paraguariensis TaxID=185542 RepID=A0ABC8RAD5_9AQUA
MDRTLEFAGSIIMKWNPETSTFANVTSLFYENRGEGNDFIKNGNGLQRAMHFLASKNSGSEKLVRAQNLMQIAMKRLQKEFYQILSMNRAYLDPESVPARSSHASTRSSTSDYEDGDIGPEDDIKIAGDSIEVEDVSNMAMVDLRSIAECMISSGYGKECVEIYKIRRKSIVDEGIYRLGVEKLSSSHLRKMDWEVLEQRIKNWLNAVRIAIKTLFNGETILCDHMYTAIANHWPEIESIFSFESTFDIRSQALTSLVKLCESVRTSLIEFKSAIRKNSSKSPVDGAGIHALTTDVMHYLCLLGDYNNILADILADLPLPAKYSSPESYLDTSDSE